MVKKQKNPQMFLLKYKKNPQIFLPKKQKNPKKFGHFSVVNFGRGDSPFFIIIWRLYLFVLLDFQYCILRKLSYIKCWIYSSSSLGFPSFSHSFDSIRLRDMEMSGKLHCMKQLMAEGEKCSLVSWQIRYSFLLSFNLIFAKDGIIRYAGISAGSFLSTFCRSCALLLTRVYPC